ncbi:dTDP-4-dehydrorhamnose reductase [Aestuariibacter salexigens]|uniref:dTDP-4-dehydrorhamnose reductase n=1 Tax=Aestuariibacter salexigens TaxID=226010 RepID=UPI000408DDFC|nr:dTDP-4-dehydrorhamnose reductase [Aestuariibacter salexigens]
MNVVVIGKSGQLAWELNDTRPDNVNLTCLGRDNINLFDEHSVNETLTALNPDVVINSAAYTAVDKAEEEPDAAYALNAEAVKHLASACKALDCYFIQVSTDFVFNGKADKPYTPDSPVAPEGIYAKSKQKGEQYVLDLYSEKSAIVRTSWLYSAHGNNFVKTMITLMNKLDSLSIVADQTGSPTWAKGLARFIWKLTEEQSQTGIFHWSDKGATTWYEFAREIYRQGRDKGLIAKVVTIKPTTAAEYSAPAPRPAYSVMDCAKSYLIIDGTTWQRNLTKIFATHILDY